MLLDTSGLLAYRITYHSRCLSTPVTNLLKTIHRRAISNSSLLRLRIKGSLRLNQLVHKVWRCSPVGHLCKAVVLLRMCQATVNQLDLEPSYLFVLLLSRTNCAATTIQQPHYPYWRKAAR